ncbi:TPA: hypothetical protein ACGTYN_004249 [Klebsiella pneumoniae]
MERKNGGWTFQPQLFLTLKGFQMAHQTPSSSLKKHPRSLRLILAELFSGRVSARLSELEEKVGQMEHRLDDHAVAISNLGARVAMGEVMKTRTAKILRDTWGVRANQTRMESSDGSISTKKTTSNGLLADHDLSGSRSNTVDSGVADAGLMQNGFAADAGTSHGKNTQHHHHAPVCHSGWDAVGFDSSSSSCDSGSSSCCD